MRCFTRGCLSLTLCIGLSLGGSTPCIPTTVVDATHYDAFWLWAGVTPQAVLTHARSVYVLRGQIEAGHGNEPARLVAQGVAAPVHQRAEIWLVYRAQTLQWTPRIHTLMRAQWQRWRQADDNVVGIQIDFDARTRHLQQYVEFLRELRQQLPANARLSITGLLDWASHADPTQINQLRGIVDEVVVQTYQGRHTITDYDAYLPRVARLQLPFKIGLIQDGSWQAPPYLAQNPWFRGYVVFLQNEARQKR